MKKLAVLFFALSTSIISQAVGLSPGTYNVGPTGTYTSLAAVKLALVNGILGPVIFQLDSSVVWNEKVLLGTVEGASDINTITFQGEGNLDTKFSVSGTTVSNYIFEILNGHHYQFKNLYFECTNVNYGTAISLNTTTTDITIENCDFNGPVAQSLNPLLAIIQGNSNSILDSIIIKNNRFINGSCAVYLNNFIQNQSSKIEIANNTLLNQTWHSIALTRYSSFKIHNNVITNPGYTGIYIVDSDKESSICNNKIKYPQKIGISVLSHNTQASSGELKIYNNVISKPFLDGISLSEGQNYQVFHNTIRCEHVTNLSNALTLDQVHLASIKNNIFSNNEGGELVNLVDITGLISFHDNNFGHTGDYVAVVTSTPSAGVFKSFTEWQSEYDVNTVGILPVFEDLSSLKLACETKILLKSCDNLGTPFDVDINGVTRDQICMMGANEKKYDYTNFTSVSGTATVLNDSCIDGIAYLLADITDSEILDTIGIDTLSANNNGVFLFENLSNIDYFIKVVPKRATYSTWLPTYAGGIKEWEMSFQLGKDICNELRINVELDTIIAATGSPIGKLSGTILYEGLNKGTDPIAGLDVVLDRIPPSKTVMVTTTDAYGNYNFDNLPTGKYQVVIDYPGIRKDTLHTVDIDGSNTDLINLDYCIDTSATILLCGIAKNVSVLDVNSYHLLSAWPNPFNDKINITLPSTEKDITVKVYDMIGRSQSIETASVNDQLEIKFGSQTTYGTYVIQVQTSTGLKTAIVYKK